MGLFDEPLSKAQGELLTLHHKLDAIDSESLASIESKESLFRTLTSSASFLQAARPAMCGRLLSLFQEAGRAGAHERRCPRPYAGYGRGCLPAGVRERSREASMDAAFFHWPIEFPKSSTAPRRASTAYWESAVGAYQAQEEFSCRSPLSRTPEQAERGTMSPPCNERELLTELLLL